MSTMRYAGLSDTGQYRRTNEDRWLADGPLGLFLVVDGVGGEAGGGLAAQMIVDAFPSLLRRNLRGVSSLANGRAADRIQDVIAALNGQVWSQGRKTDPQLRGMGATLVFALVWDCQVLIAHVGDSRAYLLRDDTLEQLTKDHSTVQRLLDEGKIKPEQAAAHAAAGELTRYVGLAREVKADVRLVDARAGRFAAFVQRRAFGHDGSGGDRRHPQPPPITGTRACRLLVDSANLKGGDDNITAVVIAPSLTAADRGRLTPR